MTISVYPTQKDAISNATRLAKEAARDNGCEWVERVLIASGDTLVITSTAGGRVTHRLSPGWDRDGLLHGSRRVMAVAN